MDVVDLLGLVEDVGDVAVGRGQVVGQPQRHGDAALHVAGAEAVQVGAVVAGGQVAVQRDGVDVAGDHHPLAAAEVGAGHQRVADPGHLEVVELAQRRLDRVGERLLVPGSPTRCRRRPRSARPRRGQVECHGLILSGVPVASGACPSRPQTRACPRPPGATASRPSPTTARSWTPGSPPPRWASPTAAARRTRSPRWPRSTPSVGVHTDVVTVAIALAEPPEGRQRRLPAAAPAQPPAGRAALDQHGRHLRRARQRRLDQPRPLPGRRLRGDPAGPARPAVRCRSSAWTSSPG